MEEKAGAARRGAATGLDAGWTEQAIATMGAGSARDQWASMGVDGLVGRIGMNLFRLAHALKWARTEIKKPNRRPKGDIVIIRLGSSDRVHVARLMKNGGFQILWPTGFKVSRVGKQVVITQDQILAAAQ